VVPTIASVLHGFRHPLHQLSLQGHHVHQFEWWRWQLLRLRLALLRFGLSFLLFVINFRVLGWRRHAHDPVD
jgi:hypothetical protein